MLKEMQNIFQRGAKGIPNDVQTMLEMDANGILESDGRRVQALICN